MKSAILILITLFSFVAWGGLGDTESSIAHDRQMLKGNQLTQPQIKNGYTIHEMQSQGNTIRECVSPQGVVVAVSWRGIKTPNLSILLNSYYSEYQAKRAKQARHKGHGPVRLKTSQIVVERGGHQRDLRGRAYLISQFPNGLSQECAK